MDSSSYIQEASLNKPLQREIFKTLFSHSSNSPFSLSLITSLMSWLESLFFIDFSFPITSTIAIVEFYTRDHWSLSEVRKSSSLLKWRFLWVSMSAYLLEMGLFVLHYRRDSVPYYNSRLNNVFSYVQFFIIFLGKKTKILGKKGWALEAIEGYSNGRYPCFTILKLRLHCELREPKHSQ